MEWTVFQTHRPSYPRVGRPAWPSSPSSLHDRTTSAHSCDPYKWNPPSQSWVLSVSKRPRASHSDSPTGMVASHCNRPPNVCYTRSFEPFPYPQSKRKPHRNRFLSRTGKPYRQSKNPRSPGTFLSPCRVTRHKLISFLGPPSIVHEHHPAMA